MDQTSSCPGKNNVRMVRKTFDSKYLLTINSLAIVRSVVLANYEDSMLRGNDKAERRTLCSMGRSPYGRRTVAMLGKNIWTCLT